MNYSKLKITLNIQSTVSQRSIPVKLNDTARILYITLNDGGVPYYLPDGCRAVFFAKKPDGKTLINDCIIEDNAVIRYNFTANTSNVSGIINCEMRIYGADGLLITTPKFVIVVDSRVSNDDSTHLSENEATAWDNIFVTEQQRVAAEEERNTAFNAAIKSATEATNNATHIADTIQLKMLQGEFNGKDGKDGKDGANGKNGTNGRDGVDGINGADGKNGRDGIDGRDGADGKDGITPHIGDNGNWWIGSVDTCRSSKGENGKDGVDGMDYVLTSSDKTEIANIVLSNFPIAEDISV
jgi:hypothetical protein